MDRTLLMALAILVITFALGHMCRAGPSVNGGWSSFRNRVDEENRHVNECENSVSLHFHFLY